MHSIAKKDYDMKSFDVVPVCDPSNINDAMKKLKAESMLALSTNRPGMNVEEVNKYYIESMQIPDMKRFIQPVQPQVDPKVEIEKSKLQIEMGKLKLDTEKFELEKLKTNAEISKIKEEMTKLRAESINLIAEAESKEQGDQIKQYEQEVQGLNDKINMMTDLLEQQTGIINKSNTTQEPTEIPIIPEPETTTQGEPNVNTSQPNNITSPERGIGRMDGESDNTEVLPSIEGTEEVS